MKIKDSVIILILILIDQVSKSFAFNLSKDNYKIINDFFYVTKVKNKGAAWGAFSGQMWLFYIVSIIALYFMYKLYTKSLNLSKYLNVAILFMIAGTIGNFIDRILFGYVRDFLNFFIFTYDYPVFNFADMLLVVGVGLVILYIVKNPEQELLW